MTACDFHSDRPATHVVEWCNVTSDAPFLVEHRCADCALHVRPPVSGYLTITAAKDVKA